MQKTFYTVIIFLARNGRIRAVKFRPKNFKPNSEKIRPKFLRANLNCADSPVSPEKISNA
jgi:hypothetical protein